MPHRTGDFSVLGFLSMDLDNMIYRFPYQDYPFDFDTFLRQIQTANLWQPTV